MFAEKENIFWDYCIIINCLSDFQKEKSSESHIESHVFRPTTVLFDIMKSSKIREKSQLL